MLVKTRREALADIEQMLTLTLIAMADDGDPDGLDPITRNDAINHMRANLRALGVTDDELDAAGIKFDESMIP